MKIERFADDSDALFRKPLNIIEDPAEYTKSEIEKLFGGHSVLEAHALLGFIQLLAGYYMILVNKTKESWGFLADTPCTLWWTQLCCISQILLLKCLVLKNGKEGFLSVCHPLSYRDMLQGIDLTQNFFYSHTYNLTRTLQFNLSHCWHRKQPPHYATRAFSNLSWQYDDAFYVELLILLQPLLNSEASSFWMLPLVHGDFSQSSKSNLALLIITLLSCKCAQAKNYHFSDCKAQSSLCWHTVSQTWYKRRWVMSQMTWK